MASDTPRTDAEIESYGPPSIPEGSSWVMAVVADFARQLERELGAARDQLAAVTRERDTAIQHMSQQSRDAGLLEAEVERLRALLRRWVAMATDGENVDEDIMPLVRESRAAIGDDTVRLRALLRECEEYMTHAPICRGMPNCDCGYRDCEQRIRAAIGEGK